MNISDIEPMLTVEDEAFSEEYRKIILAINPTNDTPIDLWKKLEMISKEEIIESIKNSSRDSYFALYTDYSDEQACEIYSLTKGQAISFIADNFDEDREEGIDIIMCDDLYDMSYLGNHDGILLKKKTENI